MKKFFICALTVISFVFTSCSGLFTSRDEICSVVIDTDSISRAVSSKMTAGSADFYKLIIKGYEFSVESDASGLYPKNKHEPFINKTIKFSLSKPESFTVQLPQIKQGMYAGFSLYITDDAENIYFESPCSEFVILEKDGSGNIHLCGNVVNFKDLRKPAELNFTLDSGETKFVKNINEFNEATASSSNVSKIILKSDINVSSYYLIDKTLTIDLNGHTIGILSEMEQSQGYVFQSKNCNLTIKNGTIDFNNLPGKTFLISSNVDSNAVEDYSLNLENIYFTGTASGEMSDLISSAGYISDEYSVYRGSNCTISRCKFEKIDLTQSENCNSVISQNIYGKLRIKNSAFVDCAAKKTVIYGSGNDTLLENVLIKSCRGQNAGAVFQDEQGCTVLADNTVIEDCFVTKDGLGGDGNHCAAAIQSKGKVVICGAKIKAPENAGDCNGTAVATVFVAESGTFEVTDSYTHTKDDGEDSYTKRDSNNFNAVTALKQDGVKSYSVLTKGRVLLGGKALIDGVMRFEDDSGYLMMISEKQPDNLKVSVNRAPTDDANGIWNTPFGTPGTEEGLEIIEPAYKNISIDISKLTEFETTPAKAHWETSAPDDKYCPKIIYE